MAETKVCKGQGKHEYPITDKFCRECRRDSAKKWAKKDRAANPEKHKAQKAAYRNKPENRAKEAEYIRQYREEHPEYVERCLAARKESWPEYYEKNAEVFKARSAEWYAANKERALAYWKERYRESPEKFKQKALAWAQAHPESRRSTYHNRRSAEGKFTAQDWKVVIDRQEGRCAHCNVECTLTVDHIVPLARGGTNWPDNIQGLCLSCNCAKGAKLEEELGEAA